MTPTGLTPLSAAAQAVVLDPKCAETGLRYGFCRCRSCRPDVHLPTGATTERAA